MAKVRVLFICNHNAGRSQISEALLNHFYGDEFEAKVQVLNLLPSTL